MSAIELLLERNAEFAASFTNRDLPPEPSKRVAIVACMDARMQVRTVLGLQDGDAHIIQNAGGAVTDDVIRSLTLSQRVLGTREIMLIHHTGCGMLTVTDAEVKEAIHNETGIRPPFSFETFTDLDEDVRQSIVRIQASPFVVHKDAIRGFVYEVETGRLREVE